jgi:plasmid maintenance system antidote protein VapI
MSLVSFGHVIWLLGLSRSRVKQLVQDQRLISIPMAGVRMIRFSSVCKYATESRRWREHRQELQRAKAMN